MSDDAGWLSRLMESRKRTDESGGGPEALSPLSPEAMLEAERLCSRAAEAKQAGEKDEAVELYERAVRLNPRLIHGWLNLAVTLYEIRRPKAALECLEKARELQDANPNFEAAISQLLPICQHAAGAATGNEEAEVWVRRGLQAEKAERPEEAIGYYERARLLDPRNPRAPYLLGVALLDTDRVLEAVELFEEARHIDDPETNAWLAEALPSYHRRAAATLQEQGVDRANHGEWAEALRCFERSLRLDPYDMHTLCFRGIALINSARRYREALFCFEMAERLGHPDVDELKSLCRKALGTGGEA